MNKKLEEQMQELRSENDLLKQKVQDLERESKEQYLLLEEKENAISKMKSSKQKSKELIQTSIGKVNELEKAIQKKKPSLKKRIEDDIDSESDKESESIELHPISSKKKASTTNSSFSKRPSSPVLKDKKRKGSGIDQLSKNSELVSKTMKTFSEFMGSMKIPKLK
jgi:chromosome segregation ATPase